MSGTFDPKGYLVKLHGREYLEVKWRLLWLRTEHPDAVIETDLASLIEQPPMAIFKATVSIPGGGSATGWGQEEAADFGDYLEKAETKALGRALAALGFGTQFTDDYAVAAHQGGEGPAAGRPVVQNTRSAPSGAPRPPEWQRPASAPLPLPLPASSHETPTGAAVDGRPVVKVAGVECVVVHEPSDTAKQHPIYRSVDQCNGHGAKGAYPFYARLTPAGQLTEWKCGHKAAPCVLP